MNKLIYTINYGNYDPIHKPKIITPGWDYVCVTDNPKSGTGWNMLPYDNDMPRWLIAREPKIKFDKFFPEYDISIYIDGGYMVNVDLNWFLEGKLSESADMALQQHPSRHCIYNEINACVVHTRMTKQKASEIELKYKGEGVPKCEGMTQNGIIIRKHNRGNLNKFCDMWFEETKFTTRDQLSFMYTYHKNKIISFNLFSAYGMEDQFKLNRHNNGL